MGFGSGLAGFASGLNGGLQIGGKLNDLIEDDKLAKVREQGMAEARALQAKASPQVTDNGDVNNLTSRPQMSQDPMADRSVSGAESAIPGFMQQAQAAEVQRQGWQGAEAMSSRDPKLGAPEPVIDPKVNGLQLTQPKRFTAGNKEFGSKDEADAYSKSQAPDLETFYAKTLVPKMRDQLMAMGRTKEAGEWEKYAEESTTKAHMKTWSKAFAHAQKEDYEGSAHELMKLYPDYDDGFELVSSKKDKGPNGEDGFTMVVKDGEGNERSVFHDAKTITEVGLAQLSPIEMFNQRFKRQNAADTLEAREAMAVRNDNRDAKSRAQLESERQKSATARNDADNKAAQERAATKAKSDVERDATKASTRMAELEKREELRVTTEARKLAATIKKGDTPEKQYMAARKQVTGNPMAATWTPDQVDEETRNVLDRAKKFADEKAPSAAPAAKGSVDLGMPAYSPPPAGKKSRYVNGQIVWVDK